MSFWFIVYIVSALITFGGAVAWMMDDLKEGGVVTLQEGLIASAVTLIPFVNTVAAIIATIYFLSEGSKSIVIFGKKE